MEDPRFPILISAPSSSQAGSSALQEKKHILTFGHIEGIPVGAVFESFEQLRLYRLHPAVRGGVAGRKHEGVESITINGEYENLDEGDTIIYTGSGGRNMDTKKQVFDQSFDNRLNQAFLTSLYNHRPVRVIRGAKAKTIYSPKVGYRYDGLYQVVNAWQSRGAEGMMLCRFQLQRVPDETQQMRYEPVTMTIGSLLPGSSTSDSCTTKSSPTDDIIFSPVEIDQLVGELDKIGVEGSDILFEDILKNLKGEGILD